MVGEFIDVIRTIEAMKTDGVLANYAIGGAMAFTNWAEAVHTEDLDVVVIVAGDAPALDPLRPVFEWLARHNIAIEGEHAMIAGVPVQFLPAWNALVEAAVEHAATVPYDANDPASETMRIITAAYLAASWKLDPAANTTTRAERVARLYDAGATTRDEVNALVERYRNG